MTNKYMNNKSIRNRKNYNMVNYNMVNYIRSSIFILLVLFTNICFAQVWTDRQISNEKILKKSYITIGYNTKYNIPNYVGEVLTYNMTKGSACRSSRFFIDESLHGYNRITTYMYNNSGYDRGHCAPAADFSFNQVAMNESFLMSNICPQTPTLNRKCWKNVEEYVRSLTQKCDTLYIITGTIGNIGYINNQIGIPKKIYKAVIGVKSSKIILSIGFIYNNDNSNQSIAHNKCTIDRIKFLINRNLFFFLENRYSDVNRSESKIMIP
jgi:endonuclease G, mitochondrial